MHNKLSEIRQLLYSLQEKNKKIEAAIDEITGPILKDIPGPAKDPGEPNNIMALIDLIRNQLYV